MRPVIIPVLLLGLFFIFPFQVFIIGQEMGIGIQGAVYRYQVTGYGNSFILLPQEVGYVLKGIYTGLTALSVIIWSIGTMILSITIWFALIYMDGTMPDINRKIQLGLVGSCVCFLISCIARYGIFFHSSSGTSIPFGVVVILCWLGILSIFPDFFGSAKEAA